MLRRSAGRYRLQRRGEQLEERRLLSVTALDDAQAAAAVGQRSFDTQVVSMPEGLPFGMLQAAGTSVDALNPDGTSSSTFLASTNDSSVAFASSLEPDPPTDTPFDIVLIPSDTLLEPENRLFLEVYHKSAEVWEQLIDDPVTVFLNIDIQDLGNPGPLAFAASVLTNTSYSTIRQALVSDAELDDEVTLALPTIDQYDALLPSGFGLTGNVTANKAVLKALGFTNLDAQLGQSDAQIVVTTNDSVIWDFDNTDGVDPVAFDLESTILHEIGHALGFTSGVGIVDTLLFNFQTGIVSPNVLDIFRFENNTPGRDPSNEFEFTFFPRSMLPGGDTMFDDLDDEWRFSTGPLTGDGAQTSHWKSSVFTGVPIGVMDAFASPGVMDDVTRADLRAFDLMGWDIVDPAARADVVGDSLSLVQDPFLFGGDQFDLDYRLKNIGLLAAPDFNVSVFLSTDPVIGDFTDAFLGTIPVSSIGALDSSPLLRNGLFLPPPSDFYWQGKVAGDYFIGFVADPLDEVFESIETNNSNLGLGTDIITTFITPDPMLPDLRGNSFDVEQAFVTPGDSLDLDFMVENDGSGDATPFTVEFRLSTDQSFDSSDFLLGEQDFPLGLARNTISGLNEVVVNLPTAGHPIYNAGNGPYFVGMIIDPEDLILESFENNNSGLGNLVDFEVIQVIVTPPGPDVRGDLFNVVIEPLAAGDNAIIDFAIRNGGDLSAGPFNVNFYVSTDPTIETSDFLLGQHTINSLNNNTSTPFLTRVFQLPEGDDPFWEGAQTYYIGLIVDPENQLFETNELNNSNQGDAIDRDAVDIDVPPQLADLVGEAFDVVPLTANPGETVDIEYSIGNIGAGAAGPFGVRFYLSTNQLITTSDTLLVQNNLAGLAGGVSTGVLTQSVTLPANQPPGTVFLGMFIDAAGVVPEVSESNNRNQGDLIDLNDLLIVAPPNLEIEEESPVTDTIGAFNPATAQFLLRSENSSGPADVATFNFGQPGWLPITGDWDGDGVDTVGLYNPATATFFLKNSNSTGAADITPFNYGLPGWIPVAGDWNNDGIDTIGAYNAATATFFLRNSNNSGVADLPAFNYGLPNWVPIVGNWNNDGFDTVGVYNASTATFFLRNSNDSGVADIPAFNYGLPNWAPIVGDWNGNGEDTVGAVNLATATYFLRNSNSVGEADGPVFNYGQPGAIPVAGLWTLPGAPLLATSLGSGGPALTADQVLPALDTAVGLWIAAGLDPSGASALTSIEIVVADLPGRLLGTAADNRITLDVDAAGWGWHVGTTSDVNAGGIDLLTVLAHELGHLLGLEDLDPAGSDDIMAAALAPGVRRLPTAAAVDRLFASV